MGLLGGLFAGLFGRRRRDDDQPRLDTLGDGGWDSSHGALASWQADHGAAGGVGAQVVAGETTTAAPPDPKGSKPKRRPSPTNDRVTDPGAQARLDRAKELGDQVLDVDAADDDAFDAACQPFVDELLRMLAVERVDDVVVEIIAALGNAYSERACLAMLPFAESPNDLVRAAVADNLTNGVESPEAVDAVLRALVVLMADDAAEVRGYAFASLAEGLREVDSVEVRESLAIGLRDSDEDVRRAARLGLAYRHDRRALMPLLAVWKQGRVQDDDIKAAGALGDQTLHEAVCAYLAEEVADRAADADEGFDPDDDVDLDDARAAARLTDPAGLGDDLVDGLAQSIVRDLDDDDPDSSRWWRLASSIDELDERVSRALAGAVDDLLADDAAARDRFRDTWLADRLDQPG